MLFDVTVQESLANAKVSARQQYVYEGPWYEIYDKSLQGTHMGYNSVAIFIRLAVVASQICEIPRNSTKIRTYSSSRSSKVIHLGVNRKRICNFLLLNNSNCGRISYRFRDINALSSKIACFPHPTLAWRTPPSGGMPCNINVINVVYSPLKSTFSGLQFRRWHYGSIFIRGAAVLLAPKVAKSRELSPKLDLASVQGHPISSILVSIESAYVTSY